MTSPKRRGFTLLETAIVLAIVGAVTAAVWQVMASSKQSTSANILQQQVQLSARGVRDYFASRVLPAQADIDSDVYDTDKMRAAAVFPDDMCPSNCVSGGVTRVKNIYGGRVEFEITDSDAKLTGAFPFNNFNLLFTTVAKRGCVELIMKMAARGPEFGVLAIKVNSSSVVYFDGFPITLADADTACNEAVNNDVTLTFKTRS